MSEDIPPHIQAIADQLLADADHILSGLVEKTREVAKKEGMKNLSMTAAALSLGLMLNEDGDRDRLAEILGAAVVRLAFPERFTALEVTLE